jgi:hypothetical protein
MRHLLVQSNSDRRVQKADPPGSTHIPIRGSTSSQAEPVVDDESIKSADPSHSPKSVAARIVPKEDEVETSSKPSCIMGASYNSLVSELDMQDLFVHIEAKEKEKRDLENSVQQLGKRLSMVQVTCEAASHKLTLLRGGQDISDVKEGKDVKEICPSSDSKEICDSSDSDSDSADEAASHKLTLLRGGQDISDVKKGKDVKEICPSSDSKETCDSSDSDSDSDDDDDDE